MLTNQPIRADLADTQPIYYLIVEHSRHKNIKALCRAMKLPMDGVIQSIELAKVNASTFVPLNVMLSYQDEQVPVILTFPEGGGVLLCVALMGEASRDLKDVQDLAADFLAQPEFAGMMVSIGEFRPNQAGRALQ